MTEKLLNSLRVGRKRAADARLRRLYPRFDSAPQLPPPQGHRRPQFCAPLRQVEIRVRKLGKLVDPTAWGFANNAMSANKMMEEPVTND